MMPLVHPADIVSGFTRELSVMSADQQRCFPAVQSFDTQGLHQQFRIKCRGVLVKSTTSVPFF
ncbi:hypothetical protein CQ020_05855 [Arthrobacter sp. MYb23]|nr:hypothetical protein CQ038_08485 [Arthrobacter sp. MYb51]PRB97971.1 hypothetical protein CQ020_05855 [Arthrobacter sp. MYb23]